MLQVRLGKEYRDEGNPTRGSRNGKFLEEE